MPRPDLVPPIGLRLARTARTATQAFERALAEAGGSQPMWQVLLLVRSQQWGTQTELAEAMGVTPATLTHHLAAFERQGLVRRWREQDNRRVQRVELTEDGERVFATLREVAVRHDARLRSALTDDEAQRLAALLDKLLAGLEPSAPGDAAPT